MRISVRILAILPVLAGLGAIPACSGGGSGTTTTTGGKPKVAVVTNCVADFWNIAEAGANKAAKEFDVELEFRQPPGDISVSSQKPAIDALSKSGISGIAISVVDPKEQTPDLKLLAKQLTLITMDNDAPESGRVCYIGIDNYEAGKAVGRLIKQAYPNGGTVALFIGSTTSANAKARVGGVVDELAGEKDAKGPKLGKFTYYRGEPITDGSNKNKAQDNAKAVLEDLKDTPNVCLVGLYAYNPGAILEAARAKGLVSKIKIAAFDEDDTTLEGIAKDEILGTVVQDPFNYGYESVKTLAAFARGDKSKIPGPIAYRVVTKDGGETQKINGLDIQNLKAAEFAKQLKDDRESAKK